MLSSIVNQNKLNNSPLPQIIYVKTFQLYIVGLINFSIIIILFWLNVITYTKKARFCYVVKTNIIMPGHAIWYLSLGTEGIVYLHSLARTHTARKLLAATVGTTCTYSPRTKPTSQYMLIAWLLCFKVETTQS